MGWFNILDSWILVLTVFLGGYILYLYHKLTYFKRINIPYVTPLPFLGNMGRAIFRVEHLADTGKRMYNLDTNSKYIGFYDFHSPIVMIRDPEIIKLVGVKNFENFPNHRSFVDETQDAFFGKNLFALKDAKWKEVRTLLTPAFTASKMRLMFELLNKCAVDFVGNVMRDATTKSPDVEIKDAFTKYTNDVIASCAFGLSVDSMRNPKNDFYIMGKKATALQGFTVIKLFFIRSFPKLCKLLNIRLLEKKITDFFMSIVQQTVETRDKQGIVRPDMLQLMMEARGKTSDLVDMNIEEMTAQAFIFFFAGFDTSSILMCYTATLLSLNPEVQEKLQREVDAVMEETKGNPTYDKIVAMPYMDAVLNETLRLYPLAPLLDRVCVSEFELPPNHPGEEPIVIKPGSAVWFPAIGIHYDSKYYPEPEVFNPDRFLNVKVALNQSTYLPFGIGPRACIGNRFALMECKAVIFHLLTKCNFRQSDKLQLPLKFDSSTFSLLPKGGFWIKLEERKNVKASKNGMSQTVTSL